MKRILICAAAAIVALASCSKTQVVYNDAPEEIGFKAVTGAMTKAPITNTTFPEEQDMYVFAYKNVGKGDYFTINPVLFENNDDAWVANPKQYYPTEGKLDFVAFTKQVTKVSNVSYTYELTDIQEQHDLMASEYMPNNAKTSYSVTLPFHHTLALVQVNFKCTGTNVQINGVALNNTRQSGEATISYTIPDPEAETDPVAAWTTENTLVNLNINENEDITAGADEYTHYADFLVIPDSNDDNEELVINYTVNGIPLSHTIPVDAIAPTYGTKYIYNITIGMLEITFLAEVVDWTSDTPETPSI